MSQFRTTADIADEVLQKSGETINGTSDYESLVITYLNKVQQAIVGGGSIFSLEVDEAWNWARSRWPIVLELLPPYVTGSIQVTNDDVNIVFSDAPSTSVEGWHIQISGRATVYKISQHDAGDPAAQLDSSMIEDTGTYQFRAFKLDYEVMPTYLYVDKFNDKIDFCESGSTQITATLTHGSYTPSAFIAHVVAKLNSAGTGGLYSGTYDSVLKYFTITSTGAGGKIFSLIGATGTNRKRSGLPLLGLDTKDYTGALTVTSTYIVNGVSRLIEPFKIFRFGRLDSGHQITATDGINMEIDYPLHAVCERVPEKFAYIYEDNEGAKWVRFSSYPSVKTKVLIEWIPTPKDLQDNTASVPVIPRKDIDVLIHGASTFILFDKEDDKWNGMLSLTKGGLEAMQKKNRSELFRTGPAFAQIHPRLDLMRDKRRLDYGYTVSEGTSQTFTAQQSAQTMVTKTLDYTQFQAGALTKTVVARSLPANRSLFSLIIKHSVAFAGGSISSLVLDVGINGDPTKFINGFDVMQAVNAGAQDSSLVIYYPGALTDIQVRATAVGDNLNALTVGSVDLYFAENIVVPG